MKKQIMKKYISLFLCVLLFVSCFVGCGKKEEKADLVVWTAYSEGTPTYDAAMKSIEEFEKSRGVNVEVRHYGRDLETILYTALESGERVDVFPLGSQQQLAAKVDYTMDLTDYIMASDYMDRAYPIIMDIIEEFGGDEGRYHAIPTVCSFNGFWYNKAAFDAAGITKNPETIEEFEEVCRKLVDAGYNPMAQDSGYAIQVFGTLCERKVGEANVIEMIHNGGFAENEKFVEACQTIIDWKNAGFFDPDAPSQYPASQNKIGLTGENAMVHTGMWISGEIEKMTNAQLEWGCFKFPYDPEGLGTYGTSMSCTCNAINVDCENPDLAWDYLYYMYTGESDKAITDADMYLVNDRTMEPLDRFIDAQEVMETTTETINYAGGLHDDADIKASINDLVIQLISGDFATGEEAAAAFDALVA